MPIDHFDAKVEALRRTRLARVGGLRSKTFSFVHRRFAEYFVVRAIMSGVHDIPLESIPEDSRWRDCLVVYCGVAAADNVQSIADYCWSIIETYPNDADSINTYKDRRAIHALRFLRDAFLTRPELLGNFRDRLSRFLMNCIQSQDFITAKIGAEAVGLLSSGDRSIAVTKAFERDSAWVSESALYACRHFGQLGGEAQQGLRRYVRTLPVLQLFASYRELSFGFSLSGDLRFQLWSLRLDVAWILILWCTLLYTMTLSLPNCVLVISILWGALFLEIMINLDVRAPESIRWVVRRIAARLGGVSRVGGAIGSVYRPGLDTSLRLTAVYWILIILFPVDILRDKLIPVLPQELPATVAEALRAWGVSEFLGFKHWDDAGLLERRTVASIITIVLFIPWEMWINLRRIVRWMRLRWNKIIVGAVFLAFVMSFVAFVLSNVWIRLLLTITALVLLLMLNAVQARECWWRLCDLITLRRLNIPAKFERAWVYRVCSDLRSSFGRRRFLESLRLSAAEISGEMTPIPLQAPWADPSVREAVARLESVWQGLEE